MYIYVYLYMCKYICIYIYVYLYIYVYVFVYVYIYMCIEIYVYIYECIYVYMYICVRLAARSSNLFVSWLTSSAEGLGSVKKPKYPNLPPARTITNNSNPHTHADIYVYM